MTVQGSDNFADAPALPLGATSLATPNAALTREANEPVPTIDRTAWWKIEGGTTGAYVDLYLSSPQTRYKSLEVYTGTDLATLSRRVINESSLTATVRGFPIMKGETYWVRAGTGTGELSTDYTLMALPIPSDRVDLTPIGGLPTMRSVSASPSGQKFVGIIEAWVPSLSTNQDWGIWVAERGEHSGGDDLTELGRIDVAGLAAAVTDPGYVTHRVNWARFIDEDTVMFEVKYGNNANNQHATRIFFARYDGGGLTYQMYDFLAVGLGVVDHSRDLYVNATGTATLIGRKWVGGVWSLHVITFTRSGTVATNITAGPLGVSDVGDLDLAHLKFLTNGDILLAFMNYGWQVCTQGGQLYPRWNNWSVGKPMYQVSSSVAVMWRTSMETPYVNGRLWQVATFHTTFQGIPAGMALYAVDPYTGTFTGPYPTGVTTGTQGVPRANGETAPGQWFLVWSVNSSQIEHWAVHLDLTAATPQLLFAKRINEAAFRMFNTAEHTTGSPATGVAVRGDEEPTGLIHFNRSDSKWTDPKYNYAWYPTYVEVPFFGAQVDARRAFRTA